MKSLSTGSWDRREFLGASAVLAASSAFRPRWLTRAARDATPDRQLVVLQLRGGNDGLNTVVPFEDDLYYRLRPKLALPKKQLHRIDDLNALHPALRSLSTWYERGCVAIAQRVGYAKPSLSHFKSQDIWDAADAESAHPTGGWLGHWRDSARAPRETPPSPMALMAVGAECVPLALCSENGVAPAVADPETFRFQGAGADEGRARIAAIIALNRAATDNDDVKFLQESVETARRVSAELAKLKGQALRAEYPGTALGKHLRIVAAAIAAELPVKAFYVTHDGFDTHTQQLRDQAKLLGDFDQALNAFLGDIQAQRKLGQVLLLSISEFGRRPAESGVGPDAGTDHGAASALFLCGGSVRAGLHGGQPDLANLDGDENQRHALDFRQVYATVIEDWLGGDSERVLGSRYEKLPLIKA